MTFYRRFKLNNAIAYYGLIYIFFCIDIWGWALAEGFWNTVLAFVFWPYSFYLVGEKLLGYL